MARSGVAASVVHRGTAALPEMSRILVLNDTRDQQNWGSQACAQALVDILGSRVPDADIVTYPSAWLFSRYRRRPRWRGGSIYRSGTPGRLERRITPPLGIAPFLAGRDGV